MGHHPAGTAFEDVEADGGYSRESALILLKHCHDMKRQETRLRLVTLLLLFSCASLFFFVVFWTQQNSREQTDTVEQRALYSKQECLCPSDKRTNNSQRFNIRLGSVYDDNHTDNVNMKWEVEDFHTNHYSDEKRAIMIPQQGVYFIYVRLLLGCHDYCASTEFNTLMVEVINRNEGYSDIEKLMDAKDGLTCTTNEFRNVFVGQHFHMYDGDHVSVRIKNGYKLISKAVFGAYLM